MLTVITHQAIDAWRAGHRSFTDRDLSRRIAQAYQYGVKRADIEFVLEMCDEPTLAAPGDGDEEDMRSYWFEAATKLKDPAVADFARTILRNDIGQWTDYRATDALRIVGKAWGTGDSDLVSSFASQHPDPEPGAQRSASSTVAPRAEQSCLSQSSRTTAA